MPPILQVSALWPTCVALVGAAVTAAAGAPARLSFNDDIQPILSEHCFHCHGPDAGSRKGKLRLDRAEFAFLPRTGGAALVKGDPAASLLLERVLATDADDIMPPPEAHKPLSPEKIARLRQWIQEGAEYQEHWAFVKPQREPVPLGERAAGSHAAIDRLVRENLARVGLTPAPEADRYALLRRVTFDLTGLPPTPAEIGDFLADASPRAYERVVDRLLASPRYGEHRARYWLDAVRYGDTNGEHADNMRTTWPYRDYVINAFNANKPFDQFAIEQIAGDLLPPTSVDQLVASEFNRLNTTTNEGGSIVEEIHLNKIKDRTQTFAGVFLGLTMGCAACHDHKFDPITQRDYYALSAFFNNMPDSAYDANQATVFPTVNVPPPEKRAEADRVLAEKAAAQRRLLDRTNRASELINAWIAGGGVTTLRPVSADKLQARFRLDEARGGEVLNTAPGATTARYTLVGSDHSWGGSTRPVKHWTGLRFGVQTALQAADLGDFERDQPFTVAGWFLPRERSGTNAGSFVSRLGTAGGSRGWDLYWQNAPARRPAAPKATRKKEAAVASADKVATPAAAAVAVQNVVQDDEDSRPEPEGFLVANLIHQDKTNAITVRSKRRISRKEWVHLAFTYDGSGKAAGVNLYVDGQRSEVDVVADTLTDSIRTAAPFQLARRTGGEASPETSFQDIRLYARALSADEARSLPHEDLAADVLRRPMAAWSDDERKLVTDYFFSTIDQPAIALRAEIARLETQFQRATAGGVATLIAKERDSRAVAFVLNRGATDAIAGRVEAGVPAVLPPLPAGVTRDRLALARWLVSPEQPLTARVTVNRMWQELFGRGLVDTPENFGTVGTPPSNRRLLDWLAVEFEESGWNLKHVYRQMVLSATYRQSARIAPESLAKDPDNKLLSRGPRFRLDGEMLRDQALLASGLLVEKIGGPSVRPYQVDGVWEAVAVVGQSNTKDYVRDQGDALYRRSVYTFWKRSAPNPVLATFDAPKRDVCMLQRDRTNTPLQALVTENATDYLEAARLLATQALHLSDTGDAQKLDQLALRLLNRPLAAASRQTLLRSLERFRGHFANPAEARDFVSVGDSPVDTTLPVTELAAWTLAASQLINSDHALNK
ncbi:DUF1553 domain-containing protein [Horticoccus sp. 23ND18S-11]|uniref:DUF1553 domain-containing protein n=1 Tax=Horticoccus sp. 23ND18S-11 TaxID=3391832 RepID=UPI0039C90A5C